MHPPIAGKIIAFQGWVVCIIATNDAPRNRPTEPSTPALRWWREPTSNYLFRPTAGATSAMQGHCSHGKFTCR